jgi:hypothetical protein
MRQRAPLAAALAAIVALAPVVALPALATSMTSSGPDAAPVAAATAPKVVIVVGAVHDLTPSYRSAADAIYAEAIKYTPNVVKIYSPNATWSRVKAAAQGASLFFYLGHGSGYPRYTDATFYPDNHDGMGLNKATDPDDYVVRYYGESYVMSELRFAKNAVVILKGLCYAGGSSQPGEHEPTVQMARERIDNFASGFLRAGARTVIADVRGDGVAHYVRSTFTTDQTIGSMWATSPSSNGNQSPFVPIRNPAYQAVMDPNQPTSGFYRSIVGALDMRTTDVVGGAGATPTGTAPDSAAPELWSMDGATTISPNGDGVADRLNLVARFSEAATWSATIRDGGGAPLRSLSGSGHQAFVSWEPTVGGEVAGAGTYSWSLHASDAAGNPALNESGDFSIVDEATPDTGVLAFKPSSTTTRSTTVRYTLTFAGPVGGLTKGDLRRTGTASGCVLGTPTGGPTTFTVQVTSCSTGSVQLTLTPWSVADGGSNLGPAGPISAAKVIIDRSLPSVGQPRPTFRSGIQLGSASAGTSLAVIVSWSGTDSGSGIKSYDVKRSVDGGGYTVIASGVTGTSLQTAVKPGHRYRFKVRARDRAGNVSAWVGSYDWRPALTQQSASSVRYGGAWASTSGSAHSGGSVKSAVASGVSASLKFTGRAVAWVTTFGPDRGAARIYIDGALVATVDTHADAVAERRVAFSRSWASWSTHSIKVVVVGTDGRPRVAVDAFEVVG